MFLSWDKTPLVTSLLPFLPQRMFSRSPLRNSHPFSPFSAIYLTPPLSAGVGTPLGRPLETTWTRRLSMVSTLPTRSIRHLALWHSRSPGHPQGSQPLFCTFSLGTGILESSPHTLLSCSVLVPRQLWGPESSLTTYLQLYSLISRFPSYTQFGENKWTVGHRTKDWF